MNVKAKPHILMLLEGLIILLLVITKPTVTLAQKISWNLMGQATIPTGFVFQNTELGGLSGITYNPNQQVYYAISDDRSSIAPARFYTLKIDLSSEPFSTEKVEIIAQTTLLNSDGVPFPELTIDPEGIAYTGNSIFISSEGDVLRSHLPFIKEFSLDGKELQSLPLPDKFLPATDGSQRGIRNNLAFESLTLTPDQQYLFTATENALVQDGETATPTAGSPCRILRYNLQTGQPDEEFLYITDPIVTIPRFPPNFQTNGLVDLFALDEHHLLALERSFALGAGYQIKLFEVFLDSGDRIQGLDRIKGIISTLSPVRKTLLLHLNTLNIPLDNIEGLTFGPILSNNQRSLVFVSDNNFNALQITQILALAGDSDQ